jgi:hypothetical protein
MKEQCNGVLLAVKAETLQVERVIQEMGSVCGEPAFPNEIPTRVRM